MKDDQFLAVTGDRLVDGTGTWQPTGKNIGIFHICLTVDDLDKAEADLARNGVKLSRPRKPGKGIDHNRGM